MVASIATSWVCIIHRSIFPCIFYTWHSVFGALFHFDFTIYGVFFLLVFFNRWKLGLGDIGISKMFKRCACSIRNVFVWFPNPIRSCRFFCDFHIQKTYSSSNVEAILIIRNRMCYEIEIIRHIAQTHIRYHFHNRSFELR